MCILWVEIQQKGHFKQPWAHAYWRPAISVQNLWRKFPDSSIVFSAWQKGTWGNFNETFPWTTRHVNGSKEGRSSSISFCDTKLNLSSMMYTLLKEHIYIVHLCTNALNLICMIICYCSQKEIENWNKYSMTEEKFFGWMKQ